MGSPLSCQSYQHDFLEDLLNNYSSTFKLLKVELAYQASSLTLERKSVPKSILELSFKIFLNK